MTDLTGDAPMFGLGHTLDRSPQVGVKRNGNLLTAFLRLAHAAILALSRATMLKEDFYRNAPRSVPGEAAKLRRLKREAPVLWCRGFLSALGMLIGSSTLDHKRRALKKRQSFRSN